LVVASPFLFQQEPEPEHARAEMMGEGLERRLQFGVVVRGVGAEQVFELVE
jgi:hypothetical protein